MRTLFFETWTLVTGTRRRPSLCLVGLSACVTFLAWVACVASVPVRAERNIRPREVARRSFTFGTRGKWGESKKDERGGWGRGKKGTLARKPLYSENPVRPRTGLLIGAAWFIWLIGWTWRYHIKRSNWRRGTCGRFWIVCLSEVLLELNETGMVFFVEKGTREGNASYF